LNFSFDQQIRKPLINPLPVLPTSAQGLSQPDPSPSMSSELENLENEIKEYKLQLETVQLGLQNEPENAELQSLQAELEEVIALTEAAIAELNPTSVTAAVAKSSAPPVKEKWSKENHPAYQAGYRKQEVEAEEPSSAIFSVNDTVSARWKSGDGGFYTARITSMTGSASDPVYIVTFKNYGNTETLRAKDIKPLSDQAKKRKADGISGSSTPIPPPSNPNVISAAASVDPTLAQQAKREPSKVSDGPVRPVKIPRKVKANKELETGKAKWQEFAAKGKIGKTGRKDSMFRTGEGVHARGEFMVLHINIPILTSCSWIYRQRP
jgi:survival-of-motor-neuron-related-splicing factor 30